jgi:glycerophosphoryl diester phosphodiesterase
MTETTCPQPRTLPARGAAPNGIEEPAGLTIESPGRSVRLKWHRLRRRADDVVFTRHRLAEGLALGASMEVDLRLHAEGGFVCLHDERLDRETTGMGPVATATRRSLQDLRMRHEDGRPSDEHVMLLEDVARLASGTALPTVLIQLDLKEEKDALNDTTAAEFRRVVSPVAERCLLTGCDWGAVCRLANGVVGLRRGFDPCTEDTLRRLREPSDVAAFVAAALTAAPEAVMIYLDYRIVLAADAMGVDPVGALHAAGKAVDAWTLNTGGPHARADLHRLIALGVDQITTDGPIALQELFCGPPSISVDGGEP